MAASHKRLRSDHPDTDHNRAFVQHGLSHGATAPALAAHLQQRECKGIDRDTGSGCDCLRDEEIAPVMAASHKWRRLEPHDTDHNRTFVQHGLSHGATAPALAALLQQRDCKGIDRDTGSGCDCLRDEEIAPVMAASHKRLRSDHPDTDHNRAFVQHGLSHGATDEQAFTEVFLITRKVEQKTASAFTKVVCWARGSQAPVQMCHWELHFKFQGGTVQVVEYIKDRLGNLLATASWISSDKSEDYNEGAVSTHPLGKHRFGKIELALALAEMADLGVYNMVGNNCQLAAKKLLGKLKVEEDLPSAQEAVVAAATEVAAAKS
ncbi:hypothetical protein MTO96_040258 [Rhipicephalus appendiculatus]